MSATHETRSYPVDDLTYDLVAIIAAKSKGLEAYDQYLQDAAGQEAVRSLLEDVRCADARAIERLSRCLTERLREPHIGSRNERLAAARAEPL